MDEIPTDALYDITRVQEVAVSPDGERVAFLTAESDPDEDETVSSLWVVPADGSDDPYRLTRASDASNPTWSPDASKLGFVAARDDDPDLRVGRGEDAESADSDDEEADGDEADIDGDEADIDEDEADVDEDEAGDGDDGDDAAGGGGDGPKPQVWYFDMRRGGDARQVTDREEGVAEFDWGPDGERIVVAARDPTDEQKEELQQRRDDGPIEVERLQHKFDGAGYLDEVTTYLFVVDVETRETDRLDDANDGGFGGGFSGRLEPAWGPGGRIAFTANDTEWPDDNNVDDVYTIEPDGSDRRRVTDGTIRASSPTWSPDGSRLAFTGQPEENWYVPTEAFVADPTTGEYEAITGDIDRTVSWGGSPQWVDGDALLGLFGDEGRTRFVRLDADGGTERTFERQGDDETHRAFDLGGDTAGLVVSSPDDGTDVFALDVADVDAGPTDDDPRVRLSALNSEFLDEYAAPGCRRVTFESDDGADVEGIAYHPPDFDPDDPDERPLVLQIHGGPMAYDEPSFRFQDRYFTSRGYVVFRVNYRGSTSYGRAFCEFLRGNWGTKDVADLLAGVDELVDRGWADPDRLFPTGFSQGGVNTAYLVTRDDRWAAAAAEHGVYDLRSDFGTGDAQAWYEDDYGLPWENQERYDEHSIITDVGNVETPLLVTAGEEDWRCPPTQSEQLYVSVRKQGVDAKLVIYQDEHHNVDDPDRAIHRLEELRDWFARHDPERDTTATDGE
jgi:dipeptidyl aminopeptidase/acylaminoacyl peptidase